MAISTTIARLDPSSAAPRDQLPAWRRLLVLLRPHLWRLGAALVGLSLTSAVGLALPLLIGDAIGKVVGSGDLAQLNTFALFMVGLFALMAVGNFLQDYFLGVVGERVVFDMRTQLYGRLTTLSLGFFTQHRTGELVSRLSSDVTLVRTLLTSSLTSLIGETIGTVGAVVIIFALNPSLTILFLVLLPIVGGVAVVFGRPMERMSARVQDNLARATVTAEEGISGIRVVKSFAREAYEFARFRGDLSETLASALRLTALRSGFTSLMIFLGFSALAAILWFAGRQVIAGTMTLPLLTSFLFYGIQIATGGMGLARVYGEARQALGALRRVFELIDTKPTVVEAPTARPMPLLAGAVSFENVSFSYDQPSDAQSATPASPYALRDINLTIAPGEIIALVGPSGAGKSTTMSLIQRFYDPTEGALRIDGVDVREATEESLRSQIGLVPQETVLFGGSVLENIRYGRLGATEAEVMEAARAANAHEFIMRLPQGYETVVGERGMRLSGGERQRVAIARAILKDPRILLLDEATSSLDNESEALVQEALHRLMRGRTTVIIAHRLSTIKAAHRIAVLDSGQLAEIGTHDELLVRGGLYARLHALQFRGSLEPVA